MKRLTGLLLVLIASASAEKGVWELGATAGGTLFHDILADNWNSSPTAGFELLYPFHPRVPVILSGQVGFHTPNPSPPPREGFHATDKDLLFFHFALLWQFELLENRPVTPYIGAGISHSTFYMAAEWPSPEYSDESEFGSVSSLGALYTLNRQVKLFCDYRFNIIFSAPYRLHFSTVRAGVRFALNKRSNHE